MKIGITRGLISKKDRLVFNIKAFGDTPEYPYSFVVIAIFDDDIGILVKDRNPLEYYL